MAMDVQFLRRLSMWAGLSDDARERVAALIYPCAFEPGEVIIFEGDPCEAAYFILAGYVRVYRLSSEGREQVLARLGPEQSFNTVPPFRSPSVNHATVEALTAVELGAIARADFLRLVEERGDLALVVLRDFAARLDHLTDLVEDLSLRTVRGRMARFLLKRAEADEVPRRWTQEEIAAYLGTVRDMVGRTLRAFADDGLIRMNRQRILLLDREGLEAEAEN
ncbi:MAG TPA: Crp/Fnr family transcriptional regulator [Chloroflexi bacterium]|nr:Crp/Fnr family transcriptional regulator [Chloroflexota bacterium]